MNCSSCTIFCILHPTCQVLVQTLKHSTHSTHGSTADNFQHLLMSTPFTHIICFYKVTAVLHSTPFMAILTIFAGWLLVNVNSRSPSLYAIACPSVVWLSVTYVHPTQPVEIFGNVSTPFGTLLIHRKFYGDRPRATPPLEELNARGVTKYSNFGPIDSYTSEMVQDRR